MSIPTSIAPDDDRDDLLRRLQVTVAQLQEAIRVGYLAKSTATAAEPAAAGPSYVYFKGTAQLRYTLAPEGWTFDSIRNFERTLRGDGRVAIALSSGDNATGLAEAIPQTKNPKGPMMRRAVEANHQYVMFEPGTLQPVNYDDELKAAPVDDATDVETWLLLHSQDPDTLVIRAELSLPTEMDDSQITSWKHRILLPPISLEPTLEFGEDHDEDDQDDTLDVDVRPKF